jgi:hypothetical protein
MTTFIACACGCGLPLKRKRKYLPGHNPLTQVSERKMSDALRRMPPFPRRNGKFGLKKK